MSRLFGKITFIDCGTKCVTGFMSQDYMKLYLCINILRKRLFRRTRKRRKERKYFSYLSANKVERQILIWMFTYRSRFI